MLLVLFLDGAGYLLAIHNVPGEHSAQIAALEDIFVIVALLSISVGLVLPGMITHSATEVSSAARRLTLGTLREFSNAMAALGRGDLEWSYAPADIVPVKIHSHDELGAMAQSFNDLQSEVQKAALGLGEARENLRTARAALDARHREIAHLAHHDALTDLPNRNVITLKMDAALARNWQGERIALLFLDLDNFKTINDTLGHSAGDEMLMTVAERLRRAVPDSDTIARLGGDEFAVLLIGSGLPGRASYLARRIIEVLRHPMQIGAKEVTCSVSIGIALAPDNARVTADLFRFADLALYAAKEAKGGTFRFFKSAMDEKIRARSSLERELRYAIDNNELEVHYQPVICLETNTPTYVEALVRWRHPSRGLILPSKFIPLAEETGMIVDIGAYVLRCACRDAATWPAEISVAVNISAFEVVGSNLVETIELALEDAGLPASRLQIEVTEFGSDERRQAFSQDARQHRQARHRDRRGRLRYGLFVPKFSAQLPFPEAQNRPHLCERLGVLRGSLRDPCNDCRARKHARNANNCGRRRNDPAARDRKKIRLHGRPGLLVLQAYAAEPTISDLARRR